MPGKNVDASALAVDRKRDLGPGLPFGKLVEALDSGVLENGVARIEQSAEVTATPARNLVDTDVEDGSDATYCTQRVVFEVAALQLRDH